MCCHGTRQKQNHKKPKAPLAWSQVCVCNKFASRLPPVLCTILATACVFLLFSCLCGTDLVRFLSPTLSLPPNTRTPAASVSSPFLLFSCMCACLFVYAENYVLICPGLLAWPSSRQGWFSDAASARPCRPTSDCTGESIVHHSSTRANLLSRLSLCLHHVFHLSPPRIYMTPNFWPCRVGWGWLACPLPVRSSERRLPCMLRDSPVLPATPTARQVCSRSSEPFRSVPKPSLRLKKYEACGIHCPCGIS